MKILAIETSCDETAVSVIEANQNSGAHFAGTEITVLGDALLSQVELHARYGGVYPNLARREHTKNLVPLLREALSEAQLLRPTKETEITKEQIASIKVQLEREPELFVFLTALLAEIATPDIDAIAVTEGPGLEPALWVGINFAKALSLAWNKPLIPVNHMEGHVVSSLLESGKGDTKCIPDVQFPAIALLISGGHTELIQMDGWHHYRLIGATRDDAVGEAFDKVARMMELGYPGGPVVSKLAQRAREQERPEKFTLPRPMMNSNDLDFSFSGLKTSVLYTLRDNEPLSEIDKEIMCRAFEDAVTDILIKKTKRAIEEYHARTIILGGGVSANTHIREAFSRLVEQERKEVTLYLPEPKHTTDNAVMIGAAGYLKHCKGDAESPHADIRAQGNLKLAS